MHKAEPFLENRLARENRSLRSCKIKRFAGETACATTSKSFACKGGACFSLPTPACGRIFLQLLTVAAPIGASRPRSEPRPLGSVFRRPSRTECRTSVIACGVGGRFRGAEHAVGLIIVPRRGEWEA